jgi:hypothetical protein
MGEYRIGSASVGRTWFSIRGAPFDLRLGHHVATTKDQQFEDEEMQRLARAMCWSALKDGLPS